MPSANKLEMIDSVALTPLVSKALHQNEVVIVDWKYEALHGASFNSEIYRFSGNAQSREKILPWSLILKIIRSPDNTDDPNSLNYWKREALVYQSDLLNNLPAGFCTPQCFGVIEYPGFEVWLWLEEIIDEPHSKWSLEQYGNVAYSLAQFNGAYLQAQYLSTIPWLAKGRLRAWVADANSIIPISDQVLAHPLVSRLCPNSIYKRMLKVWSEHDAWITFIENQPQTLAHLDAFRRNLIARPQGQRGESQTVLIDWSLVGSGALREEIAPLVAASLNFLEISSDKAQALDQIVFDRYLEGLKDTGWQGDPRLVRFTYAASSVLRYSIGVVGITAMIVDEKQHAILEQAFGYPLEDLIDVWSQTNRFLFDLADEARQLLPFFQ